MLRRLALLAGALLICVIVAELLLRTSYPVPRLDSNENIVLPVGQVYRFVIPRARVLDSVVVSRRNSLGFRGPEPPPDLKPRLSVITIGGSTTECSMLPDGSTWTDVLGRLLEGRIPGLWTNNAGLDGHSTLGHLALMEKAIVPLQPTFAVFLIGANDVGRGEMAPPPGRWSALRDYALAHLALARFASAVRRIRLDQGLIAGPELDIRTMAHRSVPEAAMQAVLEDETRRFLPGFEARVRRLVQLCREHHIVPVLVTQPALVGKAADPATGIDLATLELGSDGNGELEWRLLELHNDVTRRVGRSEHAAVIDLARIMPKDSRFFYDLQHFTKAGAEVVGRAVFDELYPLLATLGKP